MNDLDELTNQAAAHLAGRPVRIRWQNPTAAGAAGQVYKSVDGQITIDIGDLTGADSRFAVLLHELAHARLDYAWLPVTTDHQERPGSVKRTPAERAAWRSDPHEERANELGKRWLDYTENNAYKYWRLDRTPMICKLLSLLDWEG